MTRTNRTHVTILGVNIVSTTSDKVLRQIREYIAQKHKFLIVTPNPEHILMANEDSGFRSILNKAQISIPDATGLVMAAKFLSLPNPKQRIIRIPVLIFQGLMVGFSVFLKRDWLEADLQVIKGRRMFIKVIQLANKKRWNIVLLGDRMDSAKKAHEKLKQNYKGVRTYSFQGPIVDLEGIPLTQKDKNVESEVIKQINNISPQMLFVGFGAPKQEKWINRVIGTLDVGGAMVLGGTFDYIAGTTKLPPKLFETFGLEWVWRLISGSQKLSRIWRAFPIFPYMVFKQKMQAEN